MSDVQSYLQDNPSLEVAIKNKMNIFLELIEFSFLTRNYWWKLHINRYISPMFKILFTFKLVSIELFKKE